MPTGRGRVTPPRGGALESNRHTIDRPSRDHLIVNPDTPDRKLDGLPSIALREAWLWGHAVHRLVAAIESSSDDLSAQVDAMLLAVAYRNVYRGASMAARHLPPDRAGPLRKRMLEADALAPGSRRVRDMLEHFDEYEAGVGRLQSGSASAGLGAEDRARAHLIYFRRGETFALVVGGEEIETSTVQAATRLLIDAIAHAGN